MTATTSTIYPPPRPGLPYLVVTFTDSGDVEASPAANRVEARTTALRRNIPLKREKRDDASARARRGPLS
jgi:hypothetical protein